LETVVNSPKAPPISVVFVTANQSKHREVARLLSGLEVRSERLDLARPNTNDLAEIAKARVREAWDRLGEPCFLENTGLYFNDLQGGEATNPDEPGPGFKRLWRELGEDGFAARYGGARGVARVAVALALSATDIRVFEGSISGTLLPTPRGEGGYGYDRLWIPDGYDRTLGEMAESTYVVNMRAAPYLELGACLRGEPSPGVFETHVTVSSAANDADFRRACAEIGVKCISIDLPVGDTRRQPMTGSFHRGALIDAQREAMAIGQELVRRGFDVVRTKIEQHGRLENAPATDEEARRMPATSYFEYHAKLVLIPGSHAEMVRARLATIGGHLSANAANPSSNERFVTLRAFGLGRDNAEKRFQTLLATIAELGLPIRNRVREYTVYDSDPRIDHGWIE
jgi:inosine/xanthosine triphosphate pyrophosphatase family protein